jgi:hypothetical protein
MTSTLSAMISASPSGPGSPESGGALRHHPRQCRGHLGAQRYLPPALVGESVDLARDLLAALAGVQLQRLQRRPVVFLEGVTPRHPPHRLEDVGPEGKFFREEVPESGQGLEGHRAKITP